jgi:hypothetical protein
MDYMAVINKDNEEQLEPRADSLLESSRSYGYDLKTALADIIDNSITAKAKNIWILHDWNKQQSTMGILDDGDGMSEKTLREAMRLGSISPSEIRKIGDLGRFGLGLKTASLSQCRRLTVSTKKDDIVSTRCWDMDHVKSTGKWSLQMHHDEHCQKYLDRLNTLSKGTLVVWQSLDRIISNDDDNDDFDLKNEFFKKLDASRKYISMIFHRFLTGPRKINIYISSVYDEDKKNGVVKSWDPFCVDYGSFNPVSSEKLSIGSTSIKITPWVLPHKSKYPLIEDFNIAGGPYGWNAHQGFYLYREKRLIIYGSWLNLGYKKEDHYKLCRIAIDMDNSIDHLWKIDVKKSSAEIPDTLKKNLKRLAVTSRNKASEIYRARGQQSRRKSIKTDEFVWLKKNKSGVPRYKINKKHLVVEDYIKSMADTTKLNDLFNLIEKTVPIEQIIMTNNESPDSHIKVGSFNDGEYEKYKPLFLKFFKIFFENGMTKDEAFNKTISKEPFYYYAAEFEALKDKI